MKKQKKSLPKKLFIAIDKIYDRSQNKKVERKFKKKFDIVVDKDIVYSDARPDVCKLDVYYLDNLKEKKPVFLYIHGGGFVAGNKYYRRGISEWIASQGYVVVTISYSLAPEGRHIDAVQDLGEIAKWINANAEKYNYDLDKLVIGGDSAGAYYSATLANLATNSEFSTKVNVKADLKINALVLICGIYNIELALGKKMPFDFANQLMLDFIGYKVKDMAGYEYHDALSPFNYVNKDFPRAFISFAKKDIFCGGQGEALTKKLQGYGTQVVNANSKLFKDNHCYSLMWKGKAAKTHNKILSGFLKEIKEGK